MIDISLTSNQFILLIVILIYIVITSIAISKFHGHLDQLKKNDSKAKLNLMTPEIRTNQAHLIEKEILKLKSRSYIIILITGFLHLIVCLFLATNLLFPLTPFVLFLFVLSGNFWLKGGQVAGFIKTRPGQSDYHG